MQLLALIGLVGALVAGARPVTFAQPTGIAVEPAGTILVVENNPGRVLRLDPRTGEVSTVAGSLVQPYAVTRGPGGATYVSAGLSVLRIDGHVRTAFMAGSQLGPVAAGRDGSVWWTTSDALYRNGKRIRAGLSNPHGLTVARDGAVLVSDTGHNRLLRVFGGRATVFAKVQSPRGLEVLPDGSVRVIDSVARTLVQLDGHGRRTGAVGPFPGDPYDVSGAYVLQAGRRGTLLRITGNAFAAVTR